MFDISPEELAVLLEKGNESGFLLVDIRRENEYQLDHIPGAVHMPVHDIDFQDLANPDGRQIIFYCRVGRRSKAAVLLAMDAGIKPENIRHLAGGITAWNGEVLMDLPRLELFPSGLSTEQAMERAANLEKGAFYFYEQAGAYFIDTPLFDLMDRMCRAEMSHARSIYSRLCKTGSRSNEFHAFFDGLDGRILEGGKPLEGLKNFFETLGPENVSDILDFALEVEYSAYDLYKISAEQAADPELKEMFLALAQAEKDHLALIIQALADY